MNEQLESRAKEYIRESGRRKRWYRTVTVLAAVVVFCTAYSLIMPVVAAQGQTYCGLEEHEHTDECYEKVLVCTLPTEGHTHSEECAEEILTLVCGLEETDGHSHSDACYDEEENLICTEDECEMHRHGSDCYKTETVYVCGQEESEPHEHTEDCREINRENPVCGLEIHKHTLQCCSDPNADVETAEIWEGSVASVNLSRD